MFFLFCWCVFRGSFLCSISLHLLFWFSFLIQNSVYTINVIVRVFYRWILVMGLISSLLGHSLLLALVGPNKSETVS